MEECKVLVAGVEVVVTTNAVLVVASLREFMVPLVCVMKSCKVSVVVSKALDRLSIFWSRGVESRVIVVLAQTSSTALLMICWCCSSALAIPLLSTSKYLWATFSILSSKSSVLFLASSLV